MVTHKRIPIVFNYSLNGNLISRVSSTTYLGISITDNLSQNEHCDNICKEGKFNSWSSQTNFIWLYFGGQEYGISSYIFVLRHIFVLRAYLVCPKLEYASSVWKPYTKCNVEKIEMVQCLAARSVYQDHSHFSHFSLVIKELGWDSLEHHRLVNQVVMFYRIYKGHVGVSLPAETSRNKNTGRDFQTVCTFSPT